MPAANLKASLCLTLLSFAIGARPETYEQPVVAVDRKLENSSEQHDADATKEPGAEHNSDERLIEPPVVLAEQNRVLLSSRGKARGKQGQLDDATADKFEPEDATTELDGYIDTLGKALNADGVGKGAIVAARGVGSANIDTAFADIGSFTEALIGQELVVAIGYAGFLQPAYSTLKNIWAMFTDKRYTKSGCNFIGKSMQIIIGIGATTMGVLGAFAEIGTTGQACLSSGGFALMDELVAQTEDKFQNMCDQRHVAKLLKTIADNSNRIQGRPDKCVMGRIRDMPLGVWPSVKDNFLPLIKAGHEIATIDQRAGKDLGGQSATGSKGAKIWSSLFKFLGEMIGSVCAYHHVTHQVALTDNPDTEALDSLFGAITGKHGRGCQRWSYDHVLTPKATAVVRAFQAWKQNPNDSNSIKLGQQVHYFLLSCADPYSDPGTWFVYFASLIRKIDNELIPTDGFEAEVCIPGPDNGQCGR